MMSLESQVPTVRVGGLQIAALDRAATADLMIATACARARPDADPAVLTSANGQVLSLAARDDHFRTLCNEADLISADGQPMVIASRLLTHKPLPERVATTDLFHDVAERSERLKLRYYFLGADAAENRRAVDNVRARYPGINIVGARHGYFCAEEAPAIAVDIAATRPHFLWVALGVPREQEFIAATRRQLRGVGVVKTSGGLFNFLSGSRSRAPELMQNAGVEWLYRMMLEPRRLTRRYLTTNLHAAYLLLRFTG